MEVGVHANVAEFVTNVTASIGDAEEDCRLRVEETYQLALGARAGASVAWREYTWGPVPETKIPIFYTTLSNGCAIQKSSPVTTSVPTVTATKAVEARAESDEELKTTTLTTTVVYTGVACLSQELVACPASLQTTSKFTTTRTHVTAVPSDADPTFPQSVLSTISSAVPFGSGVQKLPATSGSPVSYVPPPPTETANPKDNDDEDDSSLSDFVNDKTGGVPNRVILGVSIGLGVPALIAIVVGLVYAPDVPVLTRIPCPTKIANPRTDSS